MHISNFPLAKKITFADGKVNVPDNPIVAFIEEAIAQANNGSNTAPGTSTQSQEND